jgi:hypothetical protein
MENNSVTGRHLPEIGALRDLPFIGGDYGQGHGLLRIEIGAAPIRHLTALDTAACDPFCTGRVRSRWQRISVRNRYVAADGNPEALGTTAE